MATLAMKAEKVDLGDRSHGEQIGERDVCVRINAMLETENEYLCNDYLGSKEREETVRSMRPADAGCASGYSMLSIPQNFAGTRLARR